MPSEYRARRDKEAFPSDQCKQIEENNRMGKTRDLFKEIKRHEGNISCKDGDNKGFLCDSVGKESDTMWETWVESQGWEDSLEKGKATHSSILSWRISRLYSPYSPWGVKESDMTE